MRHRGAIGCIEVDGSWAAPDEGRPVHYDFDAGDDALSPEQRLRVEKPKQLLDRPRRFASPAAITTENKRVAFQAMYVFLGLNGLRIEAAEEEVADPPELLLPRPVGGSRGALGRTSCNLSALRHVRYDASSYDVDKHTASWGEEWRRTNATWGTSFH